MDTITLTGIEVWAFHGVLPHEAELGQQFLIDLAVQIDLALAVVDDDLGSTVDYGALADVAAEAAMEPRASLIEVVAERIAAAVLEHDAFIEEVEVTVRKPKAPLTVPVREIGVTITRAQPSGE